MHAEYNVFHMYVEIDTRVAYMCRSIFTRYSLGIIEVEVLLVLSRKRFIHIVMNWLLMLN